jgi:GNAT superfamily N-acetyltransferase
VSHKAPSLVELVRAQGEGWRAFIGGAERGESWAAPGVSVGIAGEAAHEVNLVVAYGPEGVGEGIAGAAAVLRRRGLPGGVYAASPAAAEAAEAAQAAGFARAGRLPLMCAHASDVVRAEGGHATARVAGVERVLAAGDILADAFGLPVDWCQRLLGVGFPAGPDVAAFLALHDGRPVAVAGSARVGDVAGVYAVGTRLSHRRRGAGAAAVSAALDHHLRAGARWFALFSSPAAEPFFAGLGFVAVDHADTWVLRPAT